MDFFNRYKRYFILGGCFILLGVFVYLYMANNDDKRENCETTEQFPESEWMQPYELTKNREPSESGP